MQTRTSRVLGVGLSLVSIIAIWSCTAKPAAKSAPVVTSPAPVKTAIAEPPVTATKPADLPGLHNVVTYAPGVVSGAQPEGPESFDTLAAMGVKTIISVDGAAPDVAAANARGIRYIHLPIAYNGFEMKREVELARATRDAMKEGPVYIHCHHGKHRSAAAAGTALVCLGVAEPAAMVERMKVSGTAPSYTGLYAVTNNAKKLDAATLDAIDGNFPSVSRPNDFVSSMVEIDAAMEHLKLIEKTGWQVPANHPDLVPAAEAGRLVDLHRAAAATKRAKAARDEFMVLLRNGESKAKSLEDILAAAVVDKARASDAFKQLGASCKDCHTTYRDH